MGMRIDDEVYVHGYLDEIRQDKVIIRNEGGYFGTVIGELIEAIPKAEGAKMIEAYWMKGEYPHTGDVICSNCKSRCDALREAHWGKNWKDMETLGWKFHTYYQYCPHCGAKMESEDKE